VPVTLHAQVTGTVISPGFSRRLVQLHGSQVPVTPACVARRWASVTEYLFPQVLRMRRRRWHNSPAIFHASSPPR
jgi:hypothetical protein